MSSGQVLIKRALATQDFVEVLCDELKGVHPWVNERRRSSSGAFSSAAGRHGAMSRLAGTRSRSRKLPLIPDDSWRVEASAELLGIDLI